MAAHKNQHYVPRFYLRNFSNDEVGLYTLSLEKEIVTRRNLDRLCASFYFYDSSRERSDFELAIGKIEEAHAKIIRRMIEDMSLQSLTIEDKVYIDIFILLTITRTVASKKDAEELLNKTFDALKPYYSKAERAIEMGLTLEKFEQVRIVMDTANHMGMFYALQAAELLGDLEMCLLVNKTDRSFITSDNPVILHNFIKHENFGGHGVQSPGLTVILPLNRNLSLLLYDRVANCLKGRRQGTIAVRARKDVDELNRLQILNAESFVIADSKETGEYAKSLVIGVKKLRKTRRYDVSLEKTVFEDRQRVRVRFQGVRHDHNVHLSFVKANTRVANLIRDTLDRDPDARLVRYPKSIEIAEARVKATLDRKKAMLDS